MPKTPTNWAICDAAYEYCYLVSRLWNFERVVAGLPGLDPSVRELIGPTLAQKRDQAKADLDRFLAEILLPPSERTR